MIKWAAACSDSFYVEAEYRGSVFTRQCRETCLSRGNRSADSSREPMPYWPDVEAQAEGGGMGGNRDPLG